MTVKRRTYYKRWLHRSRVWRPGPWLFAIHPFFTWRLRVERHLGHGLSVWWLWFEVARVT